MNLSKPYITVAERKNLCALHAALKTVEKHSIKNDDIIAAYRVGPKQNPEVTNKILARLRIISERLLKVNSIMRRYDAHSLLTPLWNNLMERNVRQIESLSPAKTITVDLSKTMP